MHRLAPAEPGGLYAWEFEKDGQELEVKVSGSTIFNSSNAMINAAIDGYGIAYVPDDMALEAVRGGKLELLLEDWTPPFPGYYLYYPSKTHMSAAMRVVVEALRFRSTVGPAA
nr:LysR substrate-binding domain-containing protein [Salipiger thiooxidans]